MPRPQLLLLLLGLSLGPTGSSTKAELVRQLSISPCLGLPGGAAAQSSQQRWLRHISGNQRGDFRLQLAGSGSCVSLNGTDHQQTLTLAPCTSGENDPSQLWAASVDPKAGKGFICASAAAISCDGSPTGLPCCLSAAGGAIAAGTSLNTYRRCNNGPPCTNQQWRWSNESAKHLLLEANGLCVTAGEPVPPPPPGPRPGPAPPPGPTPARPFAPAPPYRDSALDCGIRALAFNASVRGLAAGAAVRLSDVERIRSALALQRCPAEMLDVWQQSKTGTAPAGRHSLTVAVLGSDNMGDGSANRPLRTIAEALRRLRAWRANAAGRRVALAVIFLRAGTHEHSRPIVMTAADSYTSIEPHPDNTEGVTLSGGSKIQAKFQLSHIIQGQDTAVLVTNVHPMTHATELFTVNGTRLTRARWPNLSDGEHATGELTRLLSPSTGSDVLPPLGRIVQPIPGDFTQWISADPYTFPHFAYYEGGSLAERYAFHRSPAAVSYPEEDSAGNTGLSYNKQSISANLSQWHSQASEPVLHLQDASHGTSHMTFEVDAGNGSFHFKAGGWHISPGVGGSEYYVDDVLAELDRPGEFYHDAEQQRLWLGVKRSDAAQLIAGSMELWAAQTEVLLNYTGASQAEPIRGVGISGITVAHTQVDWGVGDAGTVEFHRWEELSNGDHAISRRGAIILENVEAASVRDCRFESVGGTAVVISRHGRNVSIVGNVIQAPGDTGVSLAGSFANGSSVGVAHPAGIRVSGNLVSEVGVYSRQGSCYWSGISGSIRDEPAMSVSNNTCFHSARHGFEINDGFGGGSVFERNVVFSCMQLTVDGGPVHSWNRMPYLQEQVDGTFSIQPKQNLVRQNIIINNGLDWDPAACQARFCHEVDDGSAHWTYDSNVLAYGTFGNWLGSNNHVRNNLIVRADLSGTDDVSIDSPACLWSYFTNPRYWQEHGGNNTFRSNTCIHWFGDLYDYGQYWAPSDTRGRRLQSHGHVPPPYVHSQCDPAQINISAWPSSDNTFMSVAEPRVRCGDTSWTMRDWRALGFDNGSRVLALPNSTVWPASVVEGILIRARGLLG